MADHRTTLTELVTGLGTLGFDDIEAALKARPPEMVSLSPEQWDLLDDLYRGGAYRQEFLAAWNNGRAFLAAAEGLRRRRPLVIEWRGGQKQPGDEPVPADLRIDHVFLVSCKYLSQIVTNTSPAAVFDRLLAGGHGQSRRSVPRSSDTRPPDPQPLVDPPTASQAQLALGDQPSVTPAATGGRSVDWYAEVASEAYEGLYRAAVESCRLDELPDSVCDLTQPQRALLKQRLGRGRWSPQLRPTAIEFSAAVAEASARRWRQALADADPERVLWRLLRIGSAPYFVLGVAKQGSLRLRVATAWDWRQYFRITDVTVTGRPASEQPVVDWKVEVAHRRGHQRSTIEGHVEIRWSHGKFAQPPEAKVYLDTPHQRIPGYWRLT